MTLLDSSKTPNNQQKNEDLTEAENDGFRHLDWLVKSRSANQALTLKLYKILRKHRGSLAAHRSDEGVMHALIAVSFSLWRAAFLGEAKRASMLDHADAFLKNLIDHNSVTYQSDYRTRSYTFGYYVTVCTSLLDTVSKLRPEILPEKPEPPGTNSYGDWDFNHGRLSEAVENLEKYLDGA